MGEEEGGPGGGRGLGGVTWDGPAGAAKLTATAGQNLALIEPRVWGSAFEDVHHRRRCTSGDPSDGGGGAGGAGTGGPPKNTRKIALVM